MTTNKRKIAITGALAVLLVSFIVSAVYFNKNRSLGKDLDNEKLKSELTLSEKLLAEKEVASLRNQLASLKGTNAEIDKILAETTKKLNDKEAELLKIQRENSKVKSLKKQLDEIAQLKNDLEKQLNAVNANLARVNSENEKLNKSITDLRAENEELAQNLKILSSLTADNFLVETTRGKGKLTVKAKRTNKIAVSFAVPANVTEKLSFIITKPDGKQITDNDKAISFNVIDNDENLYASTNNDDIKVSKKIEMVYQPKEKLRPGTYKIEIYNGNKYVGASNVRLR